MLHCDIRQTLDHREVDSKRLRIAPAHGSPPRKNGDAKMGEGVEIEPAGWDLVADVAPDFEVNQRIGC